VPVEQTLEGDLALVRCVGVYTTDALIGALNSLLSNPDLPEHAQILLDLRNSQSVLNRSIPELRRIATTFVGVAGRFDHRCALLVRGAARYGLMRMAAVWAELRGVEARVFRDEQEARNWLLRQPETRAEPP
jgi:hypothetical protein